MNQATETAERAAIVAEARSWLGTAYHNMGRVKIRRDAQGNILDRGAVDCGQFVWHVFYNCGLTDYMEPKHYTEQFMLHRDTEWYLTEVMGRGREIDWPQPGDVVLYKIGRIFAHGGIVVDPGWPNIIHAWKPARCVTGGLGDQGSLADPKRIRKYFSRW